MRERARTPIAIAATVAGLLLFPGSASAAPPANDNFANAQPITVGSTVNGTLVDATIETPDEPEHAGSFFPAEASVWYSWNSGSSPPSDVRFSACSENVAAGIAIYKGATLTTLTRVGPDGGFSCNETLSPEPNTTYRVAVYTSLDPGPFELSLRALNTPANDDFASAFTIPQSLPRFVAGTTVDATVEPGEPSHGGARGASVWYQWTPAAAVRTKIEFCDPEAGPPPGVAVYTGTSVDSLTELARSNGPFDCSLNFDATASQTYRIAVDAGNIDGGEGGPFGLTLRELDPPANDDLSQAQSLPTGLPQQIEGTREDATREPNEPFHSGPVFRPGDSSVWYAWVSGPDGGRVVVDACDDLATIAAVYAGDTYTGPGALVPAAANNGRCKQRFDAAPSTRYSIVIDGPEDSFTFDLRPLDPPSNDDLSDAQPIAGLPLSIAGTNLDATAETGEPNHTLPGFGAPAATVWYSWNSGPGEPKQVAVDACEEGRPMFAAVYTGTTYSGADPLTLTVGQNMRCRLRFTAAPMTTYRIAVDSDTEGEFTLRMRLRDPPDNDNFANAQVLPSVDTQSLPGTNFDATAEAGEPNHFFFPGPPPPRASVWYVWTAPSQPATRSVTVDTCDTDFTNSLAVYTGNTVGNLNPISGTGGCEFSGDDNFGERMTFEAVAGVTYRIAIDGYDGRDDEGNFTLRLATEAPPVNGGGGGGVANPPAVPPAEPTKKKCKKGQKLKKGKCVKKKRKKRRR